jgi:hypothetical protein
MVASQQSTQIRAALGDQPQSRVGADAVDMGQINTDHSKVRTSKLSALGCRVLCRWFWQRLSGQCLFLRELNQRLCNLLVANQ